MALCSEITLELGRPGILPLVDRECCRQDTFAKPWPSPHLAGWAQSVELSVGIHGITQVPPRALSSALNLHPFYQVSAFPRHTQPSWKAPPRARARHAHLRLLVPPPLQPLCPKRNN